MKKIFGIFIGILLCVSSIDSQEISILNIPTEVTVNGSVEHVYDFGKVDELGGFVFSVVEFMNVGSEPLVINNIRTSCKCLEVHWYTYPVGPNKKSVIIVHFNPIGRPGRFYKTLTIESNIEKEFKIRFKGEVISNSIIENTDTCTICP